MALRFTDFPRIPTPVHAAPLDDDKLLFIDLTCPRIAIENSKINNIPERSLNFTLPSWAVQNYDEISTAAHFWPQYYSFSNELKRLRGGPVFELLTENMRKKSIGELPEQKMFMYSYHGLYIASMITTMGVFNSIEIPYTSLLMFELHQTGKNYFVKVLLQNDTTFQNPPLELTLPDCSPECPLSDFINLLKDFIPKDWEKECHSIDPISEPSYPSSFTGNYENKNTDIQMAILRKTNTETIDFTVKK
ncbi:Prostatic acid phosphatase [Armadillidium nasatum]|uniref:acid phosphatase n=1 Tax=Armadillidium nasatum TaxID=96803 RepID=A0A5N5T464_9CRUS|nr:Prostatic acid phosphatase [Armadillidium nasatum]